MNQHCWGWIRVWSHPAYCNKCDCVLSCKKSQSKDDRATTFATYTAPETTNLVSPNVDTRRAGQYFALGQMPVGVQEPVGGLKIVINNDMQFAYASALLDHLEDLGTNMQFHHRKLRARHYPALPVDI